VLAEGLHVREAVPDAAVIARIPRSLSESDIGFGAGQRRAIATDHLGGFAWAEQTLEGFALMGLSAERVHAIQKALAAGKDIAQLVNCPYGWHTDLPKEPLHTHIAAKIADMRA